MWEPFFLDFQFWCKKLCQKSIKKKTSETIYLGILYSIYNSSFPFYLKLFKRKEVEHDPAFFTEHAFRGQPVSAFWETDFFRRSSYDQAAMAAAEEEQTKGKKVLMFQHRSMYCTSMHLRECLYPAHLKNHRTDFEWANIGKQITAPLVIAHTAHMYTQNREEVIKEGKQLKWILFSALKGYSLGYQIAPHIWHQSLQGSELEEKKMGGWTSQVENREYGIWYKIQQVDNLAEDLANRRLDQF